MKITKVSTKAGEMRTPATIGIDDIVERMRSPKTKDITDRIAAVALRSRLAMQQGAPRYLLTDSDRLPYLIFSATFSREGFDKPKAFTGLVMLNIPCPNGIGEVSEMRRRVSQIPYTLLAFAGVSGVTLKVVVRCEYKAKGLDIDDYLAFLKDAHESAARLYTSLAMCNLLVGEMLLTRGCRMSYDPQLYYNPEAQAMPIVRDTKDPLQAYEGTRADDDGQVVWYPDSDERQRFDLEFQTCLAKALDDCPTDMTECLQTLADYCAKACLPEESCTLRTSWNARFKPLGTDLIRKTFRNAYKKLRRAPRLADERKGAHHAEHRGLPLTTLSAALQRGETGD